MENIHHSAPEEGQQFISGKNFIRTGQNYEEGIRVSFESLLDSGKLGKTAPEVYEQLGNALFYLYQIATCQWGCRGGDHIIENLVRRFVNSSLASLRLMVSGLYDEALGPIRGLAELVNLLQAFNLNANYLEQWKTSSLKGRLNKFSPLQVRLFIEKNGKQPIVKQETYAKLCENGIHVSPTSVYLSHDLEKILYVGGSFSIGGVVLILNTLAWIVGPCLLFAGSLINATEEKKQILKNAAIELLHSAGGINIDNYEDTFIKAREEHFHQLVMKEMSEMDEHKWENLAQKIEQDLEAKGELKSLTSLDEEAMKEKLFRLAYNKIYQQQRKEARSQMELRLTQAALKQQKQE